MKMNRAKLLVLPVCLAGALAASSGAALAATTADHPVPLPTPELAIEVAGDARLAPNRVVVEVPVNITCWVPEGAKAGVSVNLTQAVGHGIASGYGSIPEDVPCDGQAHEQTISVLASPGGTPFRAGLAAVQASAYACEPGRIEDPGACRFVTTPPQDIHLWRDR